MTYKLMITKTLVNNPFKIIFHYSKKYDNPTHMLRALITYLEHNKIKQKHIYNVIKGIMEDIALNPNSVNTGSEFKVGNYLIFVHVVSL